MKRGRHLRWLGIFLLTLQISNAQRVENKSVDFTLQVVDPMGAAVNNARVWLVPKATLVATAGEAKQVTTKNDGQIHIALNPGLYDVFISASGFSPHAEQVAIDQLHGKSRKVALTVGECISPYCEID